MYELAEHELDAVAGAQGNGNAFGLVAVGLNATDFLNGNSVLNGNRVTVDVLNGSLNGLNVSVPIGIAASVLGISANAVRSTI